MPSPLSLTHLISPLLALPPILSLLSTPKIHSKAESIPGITPIITERIVPRKTLILTLLSALIFTFFLDGAVFVAQAVITQRWDQTEGLGWMSYTLGNVVVWSLGAVLVIIRDGYRRIGLIGLVLITFASEIVLLVLSAITVSKRQSNPFPSLST
jgi:hypothetical protein